MYYEYLYLDYVTKHFFNFTLTFVEKKNILSETNKSIKRNINKRNNNNVLWIITQSYSVKLQIPSFISCFIFISAKNEQLLLLLSAYYHQYYSNRQTMIEWMKKYSKTLWAVHWFFYSQYLGFGMHMHHKFCCYFTETECLDFHQKKNWTFVRTLIFM